MRRGRKPSNKYINADALINIIDNMYIISILSYYHMHYNIKITKEQAKKNRPEIIELYERKRGHYIKWRDYYISIDTKNYEKNSNAFYKIVGIIFEKALTQFKYSNYDDNTKNDAYIILVEQIFKYFLTSYRKKKKSIWLYYNNYHEYFEQYTKENPDYTLNELGLLSTPSNNPISYITSCINTSMCHSINSLNKTTSEQLMYSALTNYDLNLHEYKNIKEFENDYIFDYNDCKLSFEDNLHEISFEVKTREHIFDDENDDNNDITGIMENNEFNSSIPENGEESENEDDDIKYNEKKIYKEDRYIEYVNKMKKINYYNIDNLDDRYGDNKSINNIISLINNISANTISHDILILNLMFCKIYNSNIFTEHLLYYISQHVSTNKNLDKIIKLLDKHIQELIFNIHSNDCFI